MAHVALRATEERCALGTLSQYGGIHSDHARPSPWEPVAVNACREVSHTPCRTAKAGRWALLLSRHAVRSGLGWMVHSEQRIARTVRRRSNCLISHIWGTLPVLGERAIKREKRVLRDLRALGSIPWTDMTSRCDPDHTTNPRAQSGIGVKSSSVNDVRCIH